MTFKRFAGLASALMCSTSMCLAQSAPSTVNLIFVVDESGSMSGEHAFLSQVATDIEASLSAAGVNQINYGLTGYGSASDVAGRILTVGGGTYGDASQFASATSGLVITGGFEDGYSGIDLALNTYDLSSGATTIVLVTDEDRDVYDAALSFSSVQTALDDQNIGLVTVVNAGLVDTNGNQAIATDGATALIQDGTSYTVGVYDGVINAYGTTAQDYIDLALSSDAGCAADLNVLRNGGDSATAFSEVFVACLTDVATVTIVTPSGRVIELPLNNFYKVAINVLANHNGVVRGIAFTAPRRGGPSPQVTQNQSVIDTMFGVEGLRGYAVLNGYTGENDGSDGAAGFDYTGGGIIIGADKTWDLVNAGTLRVGANIGWGRLDANEDGSDSSFDQDGYTAGIYAGYWWDMGFYTNLTLQYGEYDIENRRVVDGVGSFTAKPNATNVSGELEVGYIYEPRTAIYTALTPFAGVGFLDSSIEDYDENNGGVSVEDYSQYTSYGRLGLRASAAKPWNDNTLYGAFEVSSMMPFDDDEQLVKVSDGSTTLVKADDDPLYGLTLEMGVQFLNGGHVYAQYNGLYSDVVTQHGVTLGVDYRF